MYLEMFNTRLKNCEEISCIYFTQNCWIHNVSSTWTIDLKSFGKNYSEGGSLFSVTDREFEENSNKFIASPD
jgi:hypothetical protein